MLPIFFERENIKKGGWAVSDLRTWMNQTLFSGLSNVWKQIINPVIVEEKELLKQREEKKLLLLLTIFTFLLS